MVFKKYVQKMTNIPNSTYNLPINFDAANQEFDCFKNLIPTHSHQCEIAKYQNVRISNNSAIFKYFNIFKESCVSDEVYKYGKSYKFYLK